MDKISAPNATSTVHRSAGADKAHPSDPHNETRAQAIKRTQDAERAAESAKTVIDSRPSQAHLKFQQSLYATQSASDVKNT